MALPGFDGEPDRLERHVITERRLKAAQLAQFFDDLPADLVAALSQLQQRVALAFGEKDLARPRTKRANVESGRGACRAASNVNAGRNRMAMIFHQCPPKTEGHYSPIITLRNRTLPITSEKLLGGNSEIKRLILHHVIVAVIAGRGPADVEGVIAGRDAARQLERHIKFEIDIDDARGAVLLGGGNWKISLHRDPVPLLHPIPHAHSQPLGLDGEDQLLIDRNSRRLQRDAMIFRGRFAQRVGDLGDLPQRKNEHGRD